MRKEKTHAASILKWNRFFWTTKHTENNSLMEYMKNPLKYVKKNQCNWANSRVKFSWMNLYFPKIKLKYKVFVTQNKDRYQSTFKTLQTMFLSFKCVVSSKCLILSMHFQNEFVNCCCRSRHAMKDFNVSIIFLSVVLMWNVVKMNILSKDAQLEISITVCNFKSHSFVQHFN